MRLWLLDVTINTQNLPENWVHPLLENVCVILDEQRIPVNNNERSKRTEGKSDNELFPYYGATGQVGVIDDYIFDDENILLGEDGAPFLDPFKEKAYLANGKYWVNNHAHILKAYTNNKYLCYFLNQIDYSGHVTGTTRLKLNQGALKQIPVNFAPEHEQLRIVSKIEELFSELDKGIESLKTAREQLKVYRQAVLKHAFEGKLTEQWREENKNKLETPERLRTRIKKEREKRYQQQLDQWKTAVKTWELEGKKGRKPRKPGLLEQPKVITSNETKSLPKIPSAWCFVRLCEIADIGSGMSVNNSRKIDNPIKVPYLRVANVQRGFLDLSEVKHMTIEMSQLDSMALKQWDILFNEGGDRDKLGRGWIWQSKIMPCITQNHVFRASPYLPSKEHSTLISHWGNTFGQRYFEEMGKQTTNLASINKTVLSEFPVPLMSIDEQEEICKQIDSMMTLIYAQLEEISAVLEKSRTLRQAILRSAFSGKLIPQDPNDEPASILLERIRAEKTEQEKTHGKSSRRKTREVIV